MEGKSESSIGLKTIAVVGLLLLTAFGVTAMIMHGFFQSPEFTKHYKETLHKPLTPKFEDDTFRLVIEEKNVQVVRTANPDACYLAPLDADVKRLRLIRQPLSNDLIEEFAGPYAVRFCAEQNTYLLKEIGDRHKREVKPGGEGLALPIDQRKPRCYDLVLDCSVDGAAGKEQKCFTWTNGVIQMSQTCVSATEFKIKMIKPPGRMLKISQQQWLICLERRTKGLRC